MDIALPETRLLEVVRIFDADATLEDLRIGCRHLVDTSDLCCCAVVETYSDIEKGRIASAILDYVTRDPLISDFQWQEVPPWRELAQSIVGCRDATYDPHIVFERDHPLVGRAISYDDFASMFSNEFLLQFEGLRNTHTSVADRKKILISFLMALCFRYRWCVSAGGDSFPVGVVIAFADAASGSAYPHERDSHVLRIVYATVLALAALDPVWRGGRGTDTEVLRKQRKTPRKEDKRDLSEANAQSITLGRSSAELVGRDRWGALLHYAEQAYLKADYCSAFIMAQDACELVTRAAIYKTMAIRNVLGADPSIGGVIDRFSLERMPVRQFYHTVTGDDVMLAESWEWYVRMCTSRERCVSEGYEIAKEEARTGLDATRQLVSHIESRNGLSE